MKPDKCGFSTLTLNIFGRRPQVTCTNQYFTQYEHSNDFLVRASCVNRRAGIRMGFLSRNEA